MPAYFCDVCHVQLGDDATVMHNGSLMHMRKCKPARVAAEQRRRRLPVLGAIAAATVLALTGCQPAKPAATHSPHRATQPSVAPSRAFPADIYPSDQAAADAAHAKHPTALCTTGWLSFDPHRAEACRPHHGTVAEWYGGQPA